jgi:transketolase
MSNINVLEQKAKKLRKDILGMALEYKDGHIAPALSVVEILVALYYGISKEEDKIILSKGHGCLSLYAVLRDKGFNPKISGHPDIEPEQGIVCTTGSLGHGLPIGMGMAFARKFLKKNGHVFVLIGDGECQEGTIWESLNLAQRYELDNLTIIVDHNKLQALTTVKEVMNETNLKDKFEVFGCHVIELPGHDLKELLHNLSDKTIKKNVPRVIIANTIKGKGLSFMENKPEWHSRIPEGELLEQAYEELK